VSDIEFNIPNQLKEKGISKVAIESNTIVIEYNEDSIRFEIDTKSWKNTINDFDKESKGIINDKGLVQHLKSFLSKNFSEIIKQNDSISGSNYKDTMYKETIFKFSNRGKSDLREAIILNNTSTFMKYVDDQLEFEDTIKEDIQLYPPSSNEYPYKPYEFVDKEELSQYIKKAKEISLDDLFQKVKDIFKKYNDQDDYIISLISADTIWTYFQDLFPTTHFLNITGENKSGKSSLGITFEHLAYRPVKGTTISAANYYRTLGTREPGQCTIIEDEGDGIEKDLDKMKILKSGYEHDAKVPRINMNVKNQKQDWFFAYCFKLIIAERSINPLEAKGLAERFFNFYCKPGIVKGCSIKEVVNSQSIGKNDALGIQYKEINEIRNLLLCLRLISYNNQIYDITTALSGRDNELSKPLLQLFYNTKCLPEIIKSLEYFISEKRKRDLMSIEAAIFPIIKKIVSHDGIRVNYSAIWDSIIEEIPGQPDPNKSNAFYTEDYGPIYKNKLSQLIEDKFGSGRGRNNEGSIIMFDKEKLARFDGLYEQNDVKIMVKEKNDLDCVGCVGSVGSVGSVSSSERYNVNLEKNEINNFEQILINNNSNNDNKSIENEYSKNNNNNSITDIKEPTQPTLPTQIQKSVGPLNHLFNYKDHSNCQTNNNHQSANSNLPQIHLLKCPRCNYSNENGEDLSVHILGKHRKWIDYLPIESYDIDNKLDQIIELIKTDKIFEMV